MQVASARRRPRLLDRTTDRLADRRRVDAAHPDPLVPAPLPCDEGDLALGDVEELSDQLEDGGVGATVDRGRGNLDAERVPMATEHGRTPGPRLDMETKNHVLLVGRRR